MADFAQAGLESKAVSGFHCKQYIDLYATLKASSLQRNESIFALSGHKVTQSIRHKNHYNSIIVFEISSRGHTSAGRSTPARFSATVEEQQPSALLVACFVMATALLLYKR